jgi:hypothetical protein
MEREHGLIVLDGKALSKIAVADGSPDPAEIVREWLVDLDPAPPESVSMAVRRGSLVWIRFQQRDGSPAV